MTKNDAVGWIILIAIAFAILMGVGYIAEGGSSTTVTCTSYGTTATCVRS